MKEKGSRASGCKEALHHKASLPPGRHRLSILENRGTGTLLIDYRHIVSFLSNMFLPEKKPFPHKRKINSWK